MAILEFNKKDKLASRLLEPGWYSATVAKIEQSLSSTKKSFNFFTDFQIINDAELDGKELRISFNTGTKNPSSLGTLYLMPHVYLTHVAAAIRGELKVSDDAEKLDTDNLIGGKLDIKVEKIISDGILINTISAFLPLGKGKDAGSVPF